MVPRLLWVDGLGGLVVGLIVLPLVGWLSELHGLPRDIVLLAAAANLAYGSYSTWLASRRRRPLWLVVSLAAANLGWMIVCFAIAFMHRESITIFGVVHFVGEGLYVGGLGAIEYGIRHRLAGPRVSEEL